VEFYWHTAGFRPCVMMKNFLNNQALLASISLTLYSNAMYCIATMTMQQFEIYLINNAGHYPAREKNNNKYNKK
jgi:hypothetical protein